MSSFNGEQDEEEQIAMVHVLRKEEAQAVRLVNEMCVDCKTGNGKQKK